MGRCYLEGRGRVTITDPSRLGARLTWGGRSLKHKATASGHFQMKLDRQLEFKPKAPLHPQLSVCPRRSRAQLLCGLGRSLSGPGRAGRAGRVRRPSSGLPTQRPAVLCMEVPIVTQTGRGPRVTMCSHTSAKCCTPVLEGHHSMSTVKALSSPAVQNPASVCFAE